MTIITIDAYVPWGTPSCVTFDLRYGGQLLESFTAPEADADRTEKEAHAWAKRHGFTHVRYFGIADINPL